MTKFDFTRLNVADGRTAKLTMHQIAVGDVTPYLVVRPATEATKPYYNALLKRAGKNVRAVSAGAISAGMVSENRDEDRRLFPAHIVVTWGYVRADGSEVEGRMPDAEGKDIPFSAEACADFLRALPDWLFDDVRQFCSNPANFVDDGFSPEVAAKN